MYVYHPTNNFLGKRIFVEDFLNNCKINYYKIVGCSIDGPNKKFDISMQIWPL